ncbi:MAG: fumarylacetoacetase [Cyclobacteriaceae bacterium]
MHIKSWLSIPENSDFSIYNLPYGIFSWKDGEKRAGVAIGKYVIDMHRLQQEGLLNINGLKDGVFLSDELNDFISCGKEVWSGVRKTLTDLLTEGNNELKDQQDDILILQSDVRMHLPVKVGDYTDFYSSVEHATNVGIMFRGKENALMPNWKHIPVAYHGRASSIVVSGTPLHRPKGQMMPNDADKPVYGPSRLLDIELEMAFVVGEDNPLGQPVDVKQAEDHIFGMVIFNDWSARDIQKWEYVPLGPFLGKNFGSSVSPWIVTMEALQPFKVDSPEQDVAVLPYLKGDKKASYDIKLQAYLTPKDGEDNLITESNHKYLYWTMQQQLAHHTVNGCNMRVGDMCASGTISGKTEDSYGSLLELTWRGEKPLKLKDGSERKFLQDHDQVTMKAYAEKDGRRVGFGQVKTEILPAL